MGISLERATDSASASLGQCLFEQGETPAFSRGSGPWRHCHRWQRWEAPLMTCREGSAVREECRVENSGLMEETQAGSEGLCSSGR